MGHFSLQVNFSCELLANPHNSGMTLKASSVSRRRFLKTSSATVVATATCQIVPRHVVGGAGQTPPSETFGGALIGVGGGTVGALSGYGAS